MAWLSFATSNGIVTSAFVVVLRRQKSSLIFFRVTLRLNRVVREQSIRDVEIATSDGLRSGWRFALVGLAKHEPLHPGTRYVISDEMARCGG